MLHPTEVNVEEFTFNGRSHYALSYGNVRVSSLELLDNMYFGVSISVLSSDPNVRRRETLREIGRDFGSRYVDSRYGLSSGRKLTRQESREIIKQLGLMNEFDWGQL